MATLENTKEIKKAVAEFNRATTLEQANKVALKYNTTYGRLQYLSFAEKTKVVPTDLVRQEGA